jgi:hypothetical protein
MKGEPDNPVRIELGPAPESTYRALALLNAGSGVMVSLEKGFPDEEGDLEDPEPATGAKITISDNAGKRANLREVSPGTGFYFAENLVVEPGKRYTLSIDADGNGSIDGGGSAFAVGNLAWLSLADGGSYSASNLTASWTDSGSSQPDYNPLYQVVFQPNDASGLSNWAVYLGSERSFQPRAQTNPPTPLAPGTYTVTLNAFSGALGGSSGNVNVSDNITGVGIQGQIYSFQGVAPITITLR